MEFKARAAIVNWGGLLAATAGLFGAGLVAPAPSRAAVACTFVHTAAQLQAIANDLNGDYCLTADIDLSSISNFTPIGNTFNPFMGRFFGNNYTIKNLTIATGAQQVVGLFGASVDAVIEDVSLTNVNVVGTSDSGYAGGLVGYFEGSGNSPAVLKNVRVSGRVKCTGNQCIDGGITGVVGEIATLTNSSSSAAVSSGNGWAGGAVGWVKGTVSLTYATGNVACTTAACSGGGLAGALLSTGSVTDSFATGNVSGIDNVFAAGGLIGSSSGAIRRVFASGAVQSGINTNVGGLVGASDAGMISEAFSVGKVVGGAGATIGGLVGWKNTTTVTHSYWDKLTSGKTTSAGGTALTTGQLRGALPAGFGSAWAQTAALSYPFVNDTGLSFASPLATLVRSSKVYAFLPIGQLDLSQYSATPAHADAASQAAAYTMIARAIGNTQGVTALQNVKINTYWNDTTQSAHWSGAVTTYATLGTLTTLGNAALNNSNVLGALKQQKLVLLRGTYKSGSTTATHWMLATMFTPGAVIANDPWTGSQVMINEGTKKVMLPAGFPLSNFTVDAYQPVTVN